MKRFMRVECSAGRKHALRTERGELSVSTLLLILIVIAGVIYFVKKGENNTAPASVASPTKVQPTPEPPKPAAVPAPSRCFTEGKSWGKAAHSFSSSDWAIDPKTRRETIQMFARKCGCGEPGTSQWGDFVEGFELSY